jgi:hypothetical protein
MTLVPSSRYGFALSDNAPKSTTSKRASESETFGLSFSLALQACVTELEHKFYPRSD